ncbi:MAG TPA: universal stress protein [Burkholderiaceae bacterium]|nr:universal stress protein [Burkholderiaceae bacterium]
MSTLLLPIDGSPCSYEAVNYIKAISAIEEDPKSVVVLHVQDNRPLTIPVDIDHQKPRELRDLPADDPAHALLNPVEQSLKESGCLVHSYEAYGSPVHEILAVAQERGCDRIVMGTSGLNRTEQLLLGSVAYRVLHRARVPVTLVRKAASRLSQSNNDYRLLVPIDGSKHSLKALDYVLRHSARDGETLITLLYVQQPVGQLPGHFASYRNELEELFANEARDVFNEAHQTLQGWNANVQERVEIGNPASSIIKTAQAIEASEIVMGTHGRTALVHAVLGSVAYHVVHLADRPVTLVR